MDVAFTLSQQLIAGYSGVQQEKVPLAATEDGHLLVEVVSGDGEQNSRTTFTTSTVTIYAQDAAEDRHPLLVDSDGDLRTRHLQSTTDSVEAAIVGEVEVTSAAIVTQLQLLVSTLQITNGLLADIKAQKAAPA